MEKYSDYELIQYKMKHIGRYANKMKNPVYKLSDTEFVMYCERNTEVNMDCISLDIINSFEIANDCDLIFTKAKNGYISTHINSAILGKKTLFIHQIITNCYGNGKGTMNISVDHIDRNPCNNRSTNLRVVNRKVQESNTKGIKPGTKRSRKITAIELPDALTQEMIPKYIYYCKECYNKKKQLYREFFRIEKHPLLTKRCISSSKSNKVTILDKLEQIKRKLEELDNTEPI